ncbi:Multiple ankyrin repeats single kh domain [Mycena venus]|uniref:Multiple ankyrin repeats single kh domain n=1 Tax=Mycena venus TaxID=2733690 RepID=A0A8H7CH05_9AGAR|nr:Multiple ankyrin repeats single kh domain [Mycena venus]
MAVNQLSILQDVGLLIGRGHAGHFAQARSHSSLLTTMDPSCITANPDISGIGVRAAIYAQNLLCFIPVVAYIWDGTVSPDEMKGIKDQSIGMLAIAFAVLISTIIQATTAVEALQITRFHVAVILDLSWMNNTSTWIWFLLYAHHLSKDDKRTRRPGDLDPRCPRCRLEPGREHIRARWSDWVPVVCSSKTCPQHVRAKSLRPVVVFRIVDRLWDLFSRTPVLILGSLHLSLMAAVGIVLWLNRSKFGTPPIGCDPTLTIVGGPALFSSRALQIFSLIMYFLLLIPGVNLLLPILFFLALHIGYNWSRKNHKKQWDVCIRCIRSICRTLSKNKLEDVESQKVHTKEVHTKEVHIAFLVIGLVLLVMINIIFLVDIELTLSRNKHFQSGEDDLWSFGQVLALLLLILPLRDAWNALQDIQKALRGVQKQFYQVFQEEVEVTPFLDRLQDLINLDADPKKCMKHPGFANLFQLAAYRGRKDIVEFFLNKDITADQRVIDTERTGTYGTALQAASANGHIAIVQLLLDNRTDKEEYINIGGGPYGTAIYAACVNNKVEVAKLLITQGTDLEEPIKETVFGNSLQLAAYLGKNDIVEFLLSEKIPADKQVIETQPSGDYGTALQAASANGHIAEVQLLLDKRTDNEEYINIVGGHYGTALCAACANEEFDIVEVAG